MARYTSHRAGLSAITTATKEILACGFTEHFAFSCEFNYLGGSSLSVNQSLIASDLLDASLVTDSGFHHQMLCKKYKAASERSQGNEELSPALNLEGCPAEFAKLTYVTQRVTELFTPTEQLQKLTIQQCVELREASADLLFRLRQYLAQLTADIESEPGIGSLNWKSPRSSTNTFSQRRLESEIS